MDYKDISKALDSQKPLGRSGGKTFWLAIKTAIENKGVLSWLQSEVKGSE